MLAPPSQPRPDIFELSPVDPQHKMGKTASSRQSLLGAEERLDLVRRSLGERPSLLASKTRELAHEVRTQQQEQASYKPGLRAVVEPPPLEGSITGDKWNKFVLDRLHLDVHTVFHTIIYPPNMSGRDISQYMGRVVKERTHRLPTGLVPETITNPVEFFECFVENECRGPKMPAHFVVAGAQPPKLAAEIEVDEAGNPVR